MKKLLLIPIVALSILGAQTLISTDSAEARKGCCSRHDGVCGCKCCDGTALSDKCAPYYPACPSGSNTAPITPKATAVPKPKVKSKPAAAATKAKGSSFMCNVVSVHDGDTITCLENKVQHKIRLNGIDAPELKQAHGNDAKKFASAMVFSKRVRIVVQDIDRYKRLVGDVVLGEKRLNYEVVRAGWAWHYTQYSKDPNLATLEKQARAAKKGLWASANPVAPWDWRKANK